MIKLNFKKHILLSSRKNVFLKKDNYTKQQLHPLIIVDHLKIIYFPIPKVAVSSFKYVFGLSLNLIESTCTDNINDLHLIKFPSISRSKASNSDYDDFIKLGCVRDPWDRILSCYKSKIKKDKNFNDIHFKNGVSKRFLKYDVFKAGMSFHDFVKAIYDIPDVSSDFHFRSQVDFLFNDNISLVNTLLKYESLDEDYKKLNARLGYSLVELPLMNKSYSNEKFNHYYSNELIELIGKRYEKDITAFGYNSPSQR